MNNAIMVSPPGLAPPATAKSPPGTASTAEAPFADALQGAAPAAPVSPIVSTEATADVPVELDIGDLIQLLLGGEPPTDPTVKAPNDQLDRAAGAGNNEDGDEASATVSDLLAMLMSADPQTKPPLPEQASAVAVLARGLAATKASGDASEGPRALGNAAAASNAQGKALGHLAAAAGATAAGVAPEAAASPVVVPQLTGVEQAAQPATPAATTDIGVAAAPSGPAPVETVSALPSTDVVSTDEPVPGPASADLPELAVETSELPAAAESPDAEPATATRPVATSAATAEVAVDAAVPAPAPQVQSSPRSAASSAVPEATTAAPSGEFTVELASTVRRASMLGDQEVRLLLNPPELGNLDVRVVEAPEGLRIVLEAANAEARQLIEQQLPALRAALEARDLRVERLEVEQALETATEQESERGLRQDQPNGDGTGQSADDTPTWSPVASIGGGNADGSPSADEATSDSESGSSTTATGRVDVLA